MWGRATSCFDAAEALDRAPPGAQHLGAARGAAGSCVLLSCVLLMPDAHQEVRGPALCGIASLRGGEADEAIEEQMLDDCRFAPGLLRPPDQVRGPRNDEGARFIVS